MMPTPETTSEVTAFEGALQFNVPPMTIVRIVERKYLASYVEVKFGGKTFELQEGDDFVAQINCKLDGEAIWADRA